MRFGEYSTISSAVARALDLVAVVLGFLVAYYLRFDDLEVPRVYFTPLVLSLLLVGIVFPMFSVYRSWRGKSVLSHAVTVVFAWFVTALALIVFSVLIKTSEEYSRLWFGYWFSSTVIFFLIFRLLQGIVLSTLRRKGINQRKIGIFGAGNLGRSVYEKLDDSPWTGFQCVGFYDDSSELHGVKVCEHEVLGGLDVLCHDAEKSLLDEIWICLPLSAEQRVKEILYALRNNTQTIRFVPDIFGFRLLNHSVNMIADMPVIDLNASPMIGTNRVIKGLEDRMGALIALVLISPLLLIIAVLIKASSRGPIIFKQMRHGWDGRPISVYKFRTMYLHQDAGGVTQAGRDDPRVTPLGRILRRTSLDELPQFVNVLQGRMSIVGPRPHAIEHNVKYRDQIDAYMLRHKVKPGITGWAQISGWRGETDTLEKMQKRVEYDLYYIENWSLWFDIKIILLTIIRGFFDKNAY